MDSICVLVVDDEPLGRERVRVLLKDRPEITVVGECSDGMEALNALNAMEIDLVFLDIQMPGMTGLEVIQHKGVESMPPVIFVTAYDQHAIEAFKVHAFDYLLKPYSIQRFHEALDHAIERLKLRKHTHSTHQLAELLKTLDPPPPKKDRIMVKERSKISFIPTEEIDWIESAGNYVSIHVRNKKHLLRQTMSAMEQQLDPDKFMRIHRSTIINMDRLDHMHPMASGEYLISLIDGTQLTMSRTYKHKLERFS